MKFIDPYGMKSKLGIETSEFTDPRDGKVYQTITLNGIEWFAENLNYDVSEEYGGNFLVDIIYESPPTLQNSDRKVCGSYYTFDSAKIACPPGWEIPARGVFVDLFKKITDLDPYEWKKDSKAKIFHIMKSVLYLNSCGFFNKPTDRAGFGDVFLTSTPGSMSNGGSIFMFKNQEQSFSEDVGYGYYSVRPIRKNI